LWNAYNHTALKIRYKAYVQTIKTVKTLILTVQTLNNGHSYRQIYGKNGWNMNITEKTGWLGDK
jgi:hypothetical protein